MTSSDRWQDGVVLVGRAAELALVLGHLGHGRPVAVVGETGVGKSALLRMAARSGGGLVFDGGALNTLRWMPYLPIARAIGTRPPPGDHSAVADWVASRVDGGVLILDDVQWADQDTLALFGQLARSVKLLVGIRSGDPGATAAFRHVTESRFATVRLGPLTPEQTAQLLRFWTPDLREEDVSRIVEASHGNPFLMQHLAVDGGHSPILRLVMGARLRRLSPAAHDAISIVGLLGRPVERDLLGPSVSELVEAGLVLDDGEIVTASHPLLAEVAIGQLEREERQAIHGRIARSVRDPGEAGRHFAAAGEDGEAYAKSIEAAALADDPADRASHLAVAAAAIRGPEGDRLRIQAAAALLTVGEYARAMDLLEPISGDNPVIRAEAALMAGQARLWLDDPAGANTWIERGLASVAGSKLRVEVMLRIESGRVALLQRDAESARARAEDAWMLARAVGAEEAATRWLLGCTRLLEQSPACLDDFRAALDEARRVGDNLLECEAEAWLIDALQIFGDADDAAARSDWMVSRTQALRLKGWEVIFRFLRSRLDIVRHGSYDRAIPELEELLHRNALGQHREEAAGLLAVALAHVGRETEARAQIAQSIFGATAPWGRPCLVLAQAEIEWLTGRPHAALAAVEQLRAEAGAGCEPQLALGSILEGWALVDLGRYPERPLVGPLAPVAEAALVESEALVALSREGGAARAEALFEQAAEIWSKSWLAGELRCRWAAAEIARRSGALDRAREALLGLQERLLAAGMVTFLGRIQTSLRKSGIPLAAGTAVPGRQAKGDGLTQREREIMRLVGAGLSSRDIAQLLSIAQSTVETQIRSAMRKLGAATRVQAATLVWFRTEDALLNDERNADGGRLHRPSP
jgi:DNA-binding CsgD family transcriptional regulator/tetratricopeptide (TPR) repeat protein